MLNPSKVLKYVKDNLGFDFMQIELTDSQILEHLQTYTISEFSQYFPNVKKLVLNCQLDTYKVPGIQNEWYLEDSEGLEILNVKNIYFSSSDLILHGHPPIGPLSLGELQQWALDVNTSMMLKQFSTFDKTWEFKHPNIVRISPVPDNVATCTVEYETIQPIDFRGIPNQFQVLFCRLCLSDIMIRIGMIRSKYEGQMKTPFGDIPISAQILDQGKELRREIIDKLDATLIPNTIIEFG